VVGAELGRARPLLLHGDSGWGRGVGWCRRVREAGCGVVVGGERLFPGVPTDFPFLFGV